jgi:hypothetical protein
MSSPEIVHGAKGLTAVDEGAEKKRLILLARCRIHIVNNDFNRIRYDKGCLGLFDVDNLVCFNGSLDGPVVGNLLQQIKITKSSDLYNGRADGTNSLTCAMGILMILLCPSMSLAKQMKRTNMYMRPCRSIFLLIAHA